MPSIAKRLDIVLFFVIGLISSYASASYISSETDGNIVYSLFSTPNEIQRYDMAGETQLESIKLNKSPRIFTVAEGIAYVGFGRELRAITLSSGANQFVRNTATDITGLVVTKENLIIGESYGSITLNKKTFQLIESNSQTSSIPHYASSPQQSSFYSQNDSTLQKTTLDSSGKVESQVTRSHYLGYFSASKIFINPTQTRLYDNAGNTYFTDSLDSAEKLPGNIDQITFIDNNPIILRGDKLTVYTPESVARGEINLPQKAAFIASHGQKIFSFSPAENNYTTYIHDVSQFKLRPLNEALNPTDFAYTPEFYSQDDEGNIYLIDRESLNVFRWSTTKNTYLETWPLTTAPTSVTYSTAHKRLYLGYASGKISWISPDEARVQEHDFTTLAQGVKYLLSAGNYLFAVDGLGSSQYSTQTVEYSIDSEGTRVDSRNSYLGGQYLWSSATDRIYCHRQGIFQWVELDSHTGKFGAENSPFSYNYMSADNNHLAISEDGRYLLGSTGQIYDANNRQLANSLSKSINDGIWINNAPVTINQSPTDPFPQLSFWSEHFEELSSYPLSKATDARLLKINNNLLLIQYINSRPNFSLFDQNKIPDRDNDQINDLLDNCIDIANTEQTDFDSDTLGNACDQDDDNDSLSDDIELSLDLNPLDASDAGDDSDKDGFSNIVEWVAGSSLTDANSLPKALTHYYESFENGWPKGFSNTPDGGSWAIHSEGASGLNGLISPPLASDDAENDVNFTAFFNAGQLSFQYKLSTNNPNNNTYASLVLLIDDVRVYTLLSYDNEWQTLSANLSRGAHKISIRATNTYNFSGSAAHIIIDEIKFDSNPNNTDTDGDNLGLDFDNCPLIANEDQSDIDSDNLGDTCDPLDNRPKDTDLDSIYDDYDNCPNVANQTQADLDYDGKGDACDLIDNRPKDSDLDGSYDEWDNCPNVANQEQADLDNDGKGDACDSIDNRPKDTDLDGTYDDQDNCPLIGNRQSDNMDYDEFGDACDSDIDGDGVANEIERTFSFMSERDPTDITKDRDGDGLNNGYEIANGSKPDVADAFPVISLFDYYPLGEITSVRSDGSGYSITDTMKGLAIKNTYEIITHHHAEGSSNFDWEESFRIERKNTGIYLTQDSIPDIADHAGNIVTNFNNLLILPASMKLGEIVTNKSTSSTMDHGIEYKSYITTTFELIKTGQTQWRGTSYPSVTLRIHFIDAQESSNYSPYETWEEITYLKGIGRVEDGHFVYEKIDIINQDKAAQSEPAPLKKSGGGTTDIWLILSLILFSLASCRRSLADTSQARRRSL